MLPFGSSFPCPLLADQFPPDNRRLTMSITDTHHIHITSMESFIRLALMSSPGGGDTTLAFQTIEITGCFMDACILLSWQLLPMRCWSNIENPSFWGLCCLASSVAFCCLGCPIAHPHLTCVCISAVSDCSSRTDSIVSGNRVIALQAELWFTRPAGISSCIRGDLDLAKRKPLFCNRDGCLYGEANVLDARTAHGSFIHGSDISNWFDKCHTLLCHKLQSGLWIWGNMPNRPGNRRIPLAMFDGFPRIFHLTLFPNSVRRLGATGLKQLLGFLLSFRHFFHEYPARRSSPTFHTVSF